VTIAGARTHDGFYLSLQQGVGYTRMSADSPGLTVKASGLGTPFNIALGGTVAPNLILYGSMIFDEGNADVSINGISAGSVDNGAGVVGIGPGIVYYLEPDNVFFAGTLRLSGLGISSSRGNTGWSSRGGLTLEGQIGKEWWVSDSWGLGVSAQALVGAMKGRERLAPGGEIPTWRVGMLSLLFSATYN
jgi:hypothetical protein